MSRSIEDALAGGAPTAKFPTVGTTYKGTIVDAVEQEDRDFDTGEAKTWPDGRVMTQWVITVATDDRDDAVVGDDGHRRLFAKYKMWEAIKAAHKAAGGGPFVGGTLAVQYTGDGEKKGNKNPPKLYTAQFKAGPEPVVAALTSDEGPFDKPAATDLLG